MPETRVHPEQFGRRRARHLAQDLGLGREAHEDLVQQQRIELERSLFVRQPQVQVGGGAYFLV